MIGWRPIDGATFFECPLSALLYVAAFDAVFDGAYRENSFLRHPKLPEVVETGNTARRYVTSSRTGNYDKSPPASSSSSFLSSSAFPVAVTADEVLVRIGHVSEKLSTLGNLYDVRPNFSSRRASNSSSSMNRFRQRSSV